jgi:oxygen-dependent protoporphyrinogen oxidase
MGKKKKMIIIGGGISGLAAAWYMQKQRPEYECTIIEKATKLGGHVQTIVDEFVIEQGPRIFKASKSRDFLGLIHEVGFANELIYSSKEMNKRYLWVDGKLKTVSSFFPKVLWRLLFSEWRAPVYLQDESVWDFAVRRFGKEIAENLFDPLIVGIYGSDSKDLSVSSCFPKLKEWERKKGSVLKGFFSSSFKKKTKTDGRLFSFQKGAYSLIEHIEKQLLANVYCAEEVLSLEKKDNGYIVRTHTKVLEADTVILATSARVAGRLLESLHQETARKLCQIPYTSITVSNVILERNALFPKGFGYLVPTKEKEPLLGVLFDSNMFARKNKEQPQLTFMFKGNNNSSNEVHQQIIKYLRQHLQITTGVQKMYSKTIEEAIPQYILGHQESIAAIEKNMPLGIHLVGNYLQGASLSDAVKTAKACVEKI